MPTTIKLSGSPRLARIVKMPGELLQDVGLDFADKLLPPETVVSVATDDVGTGIILATAHAGTVVTLDIAGGNNGEQIPLTITATGSLGSVRQAVLLVTISDPRQQVAPIVVAPGTLNWRGDYAQASVYRQNDLVRAAGGALWLALRIVTGVVPVEGSDWTAFASAVAPAAAGGFTSIGPGSDADYPTVNAAINAGERQLRLLAGVHHLSADILLDPSIEQSLPALHIIGGGGASQTVLDFGPYAIRYADPAPVVFPDAWKITRIDEVNYRNTYNLLLAETIVDLSAWGTNDASELDLTTLGIMTDHYFVPGSGYGAAPLRIKAVEPKRLILAEPCYQENYLGRWEFRLMRAVNDVRFEALTLRKIALPELIESEDGWSFTPRFFGQFDNNTGWAPFFFGTDYTAAASHWQFCAVHFDYSHKWNYDAVGWGWSLERCALPGYSARVTLPRSNPELQELYGDHLWEVKNSSMYLPAGSSVRGSFIGPRYLNSYALTTWSDCLIMAESGSFKKQGARVNSCTFPLAQDVVLGPQAMMLGCRFSTFDTLVHSVSLDPTARISASYDKNGIDLNVLTGG